jgi:hypothetical protein
MRYDLRDEGVVRGVRTIANVTGAVDSDLWGRGKRERGVV